jgi:hypothetical protein
MSRDPLYALVGQRCVVVDAKTREALALHEGATGVVVRMWGTLRLRRGMDDYLPLEGEHAVIVEPCD